MIRSTTLDLVLVQIRLAHRRVYSARKLQCENERWDLLSTSNVFPRTVQARRWLSLRLVGCFTGFGVI